VLDRRDLLGWSVGWVHEFANAASQQPELCGGEQVLVDVETAVVDAPALGRAWQIEAERPADGTVTAEGRGVLERISLWAIASICSTVSMNSGDLNSVRAKATL